MGEERDKKINRASDRLREGWKVSGRVRKE
jgi:hypothetical protein